jgi:excisionase family DNA binding protein
MTAVSKKMLARNIMENDNKQQPAVKASGMDSLLLSAEDAARLLGIGRSHFYALRSSGRLGPLPVKLGRRALWDRKELEAWVAAGCPTRQRWQSTKNSNSQIYG